MLAMLKRTSDQGDSNADGRKENRCEELDSDSRDDWSKTCTAIWGTVPELETCCARRRSQLSLFSAATVDHMQQH